MKQKTYRRARCISAVVLIFAVLCMFNYSGVVTLFDGMASVKAATAAKPIELPEGTASAKKIKSTIAIDGSLTEKDWSLGNKIEQAAIGNPNNKVVFGLMWDAKYLYVGVKVADSKIVTDSNAPEDDDCVEIFFDSNNNHFSKYDIHDSFYKFGYNKPIWEKYRKTSGVKRAIKRLSDGYSLEAAFPWETLLVDNLKDGKMMGIDIGVADDDNGGRMDTLQMWYGGADNDRFAQNFGDFFLNNDKETVPVPDHPMTKTQYVYHFKNYYEYVYPEDPTRIIRLWVPDTKKTLKGLIILGNGGNGDWRYESSHEELQILARKYDFGVVSHAGISGGRTYTENGQIILTALKEFAKLKANPELVNVPFIYSGSSSGGASSYGMTNLAPERMICFTSNVTAGFNPQSPTDEAIKVPGMFTTGQFDPSSNTIPNIVRDARSRGGLWSWLVVQEMGHEHRRTYHMFFPFWEKCIKLRMPTGADPLKGPVKLKPISESSGWLADMSTYESGFTEVCPYGEYKGDKEVASWIVDKDIAYLYRGLSSWNVRTILSMDNNPASWGDPEYTFKIMRPGEKIVLVNGTEKHLGVGIAKTEFYRGGELIGQSTTDNWFEYTLKNDLVAQTFTIVVHLTSGDTYASTIVGVIVDPAK